MAPTLNLDIFTHILSFVHLRDVLSKASRTCHALHRVAVIQLLRRSPWLSNKKQITSFLAFIKAEDWRPRYLKGLDIECMIPLGEGTTLVAQILTRCTFVEDLRIGAYLLDQDLRIGAALVGLEHIKKLWLSHALGVSNLGAFLVSMHSQCSEVIINFNPKDDDYTEPDNEYDNAHDTNVMLMASAHSLQDLRLVRPSFGVMAVQYPRLTKLEIGERNDVEIEPLLYAFPNLRHLILDDCYSSNPDDLREDNRASFLQNPWANLDLVECSATVLYTLGLAYPIRRCRIIDRIQDPGEYEYLLAVMEDIRPTELHLSWSGGCDMKNLFNVLQLTCISHLTRIQLEIRDLCSYTAAQIDNILVSTTSGWMSHISH